MLSVPMSFAPVLAVATPKCILAEGETNVSSLRENSFPSFLPNEVHKLKDPFARKLAKRIERIPVQVSLRDGSIMSSCVKPLVQNDANPVVLLHGFDSSCLEWRYTYPLLEEAGLEAWAVDVLGWGFSDLEILPPCSVEAKREHLYQLWKSYIKKPMVLVGPSLGAAVAIDFALNHMEAVAKLVFIDASVYTEGTGNLSKLPRSFAYAGILSVDMLQHLCAFVSASFFLEEHPPEVICKFFGLQEDFDYNQLRVGRLHCLFPWWEDATVDFMISGGYNVVCQIKQIKQETLIIWGEDDQIISKKFAKRLEGELQKSVVHYIPNCGHLPHVEKPDSVAKLILNFVQGAQKG
ncbi:hypothetical protein Syun_021202 [Stephania yunnanensis]|uniref:AB hydrolase-1 domain-containing protein n=1 Tax=Stephania yunnanensis TaxID=152371 RepID=A0AAP0IFY9_9MAGN